MTRKIKVLHLTTVSGIGGAERMILDVVEHIDKVRFAMAVASLYGGGPLRDRAQALHVPYYDLDFHHPVRFCSGLRALLRQERYDLIQLHGDTAEVVVRPLASRWGTGSVISTVHGIASFSSRVRNMLLRMHSRKVDHFVSVSGFGRQLLMEKRGVAAERITVIHPGMAVPGPHDALRREAIRRELHIAPDELMVLTVANLRTLKGHITILEAAAQMQGAIKTVFVFAGEDRSDGEVAREAESLGVQQAVRLMGFQKNVYDYLNAADLFLLPSQSEGLPLSILEAMAMGVPVIATPVGGIPEIINDGEQGLLVPPRDAAAVAAALRRLAADKPLRAALGQGGRDRIAAKFSLHGMITQYQDLYQRLYDDKHAHN